MKLEGLGTRLYKSHVLLVQRYIKCIYMYVYVLKAHMVYDKPTPLFSSKFLHWYWTFVYGIFVYKSNTHYKPTPLFRADVWEIAHGLTIRRYMESVMPTTGDDILARELKEG